MRIEHDSATQARRNTWRRVSARTRPTSVLRIARAPVMPALSLAELLDRLSLGELSPELAGELLRVGSNLITLHIQIDRDTGLVGRWDLHSEREGIPNCETLTEQAAPAA